MNDFSKEELEELLDKDIPEEDSPYCKECGSCGESGCCSPLMCFSKLIKKDTCMNGEGYLKDITLAWKFSEWILNRVDDNPEVLTAKEINRKYNDLMNKIYEYEDE